MSVQYDADFKAFFSKLQKKEKATDGDSRVSNVDTKKIDASQLPTVLDPEKTHNDSESSEPSNHPNSRDVAPKTQKRPPQFDLKDLYRKIMKKCHPDRSSHDNLSHEKILLYAWALGKVTKAYKDNDIKTMVYIGAMVDEYPRKISPKQALTHLNELYASKSKELETIQSSIAWAWGVNWDTLEARYRIVVAMATQQNLKLPTKIEVLDLLVKHETENN